MKKRFHFCKRIEELSYSLLQEAKNKGFSDRYIASILSKHNSLSKTITEEQVRQKRNEHNISVIYHCVDTCAGEFKAETPYFYGGFSEEDENTPMGKEGEKTVAIIGSGPNRIGQGLEFDTCCTMASYAFRERGVKVAMINSNPETVSTDFNTSDRLYLEPLTLEDVSEVLYGSNIQNVICQLGGQTSINMARVLQERGFTILGTSIDSIDDAEDRKRFSEMLRKCNLNQAPGTTVTRADDIARVADRIGYPIFIRPSYVLGGQSMVVVYTKEGLSEIINKYHSLLDGNNVLIDKFLENAVEYDVDAVSDGEAVYIGGVLKHIEHAGVHSGDSACVFRDTLLSSKTHEDIGESIEATIAQKIYNATVRIAKELSIKGFMNIQFAAVDSTLYVIEVNPRASRTVPFISKTSGIDMVSLATDIWLGTRLKDTKEFKVRKIPDYDDLAVAYSIEGCAIKEAVFSFDRFDDGDPALSPQMRSTGEVIGLGEDVGEAFSKASAAAFCRLPIKGTIFVSVAEKYKKAMCEYVRYFIDMGFVMIGTRGTSNFLNKNGIACCSINRVADGTPHVLDEIANNSIDLLINILESVDERSFRDDKEIRLAAVHSRLPYITTLPAVRTAIEGIRHIQRHGIRSQKLQGKKIF